jgi:hypothetical protein
MHLHHPGKQGSEESQEEQSKQENVAAGEISHRWQPCSLTRLTMVKAGTCSLWFRTGTLSSRATTADGGGVYGTAAVIETPRLRTRGGGAVESRTISSGRIWYSSAGCGGTSRLPARNSA